MPFDFRQLLPILRLAGAFSGNARVAAVLKAYEDNKQFIDPIVGLAVKAIQDRREPDKPLVITLPPITVPPVVVPIAPPAPVPGARYPQLVDRLDVKCFFLEDDRHGQNAGEIIAKPLFDQVLSSAGGYAQMKEQRMHIDSTPYWQNVPYPGGDPNIRTLVREDGHSPCLDYEWFVNGVRASSGEMGQREMEDPFEIQSYEDADVGFTPVFHLNSPGPGRREMKLNGVLPAKYNGGVEVRGTVTWYID